MKLLLDEQLSRKLVQPLQDAFPGTTQAVLVGYEQASDERLWEHAKAGGFVLVTKDEDFQVLSFARGHPPKVVWLRTGNGPTKRVLELVLRSRSIIEHFGEDSERSLLVLP